MWNYIDKELYKRIYRAKREKHKQVYGKKFYISYTFMNVVLFGIISFGDWYNKWGLAVAISVNILYTSIWKGIH